MSVTGTADGPSKAGCSIADIAAGMYAYSAILNALLLRGRTGEGSRIDVSMLESMVEWMGYPMYYAFDGAPPPLRAGAAHATIYPYGPFPWAAGPPSCWACRTNASGACSARRCCARPNWPRIRAFCPTRSAPPIARRCALIVDAFAGLDIDQVTQRLEDAQIANARVNDMAGVWAHPQLQARQRWREVGSRPARCRRCCRPPATAPTRRAWIPCRPWAKTPTRC